MQGFYEGLRVGYLKSDVMGRHPPADWKSAIRLEVISKISSKSAPHISATPDGIFRTHIRTGATVCTRFRIDLKAAIIVFSNRFHRTFSQAAFTQAALILIDDIGHLLRKYLSAIQCCVPDGSYIVKIDDLK
jgi:hypothetical protein